MNRRSDKLTSRPAPHRRRRTLWAAVIRIACLALLLGGATAMAADPPLTACVFSPQGTEVVVCSQSGIEILGWPRLPTQRTIASPCDQVHDLAFSPDGKTLAVAGGVPGSRGEVVLLSWPELAEQKRAIVLEDVVYRVAWSADGSRLAAVGASRQVAVTDVPLEHLQRLTGHSGHVLAATFIADVLVTAGLDRSLRVWDLSGPTPRLVRSMENHTATVTDLVARPGAASGPPWLASSGEDGTVRFWQPTIGRLMRFARLESDPLAIAWTPDGQRVVAACRDGRLRTIDPVRVVTLADQPALEGWPYAVAVARDGDRAMVVGERLAKAVVPLSDAP